MISRELGVRYHGLRLRTTGYRQLIECHLLFQRNTLLRDAHRLATSVEERLPRQLSFPAEVITHLESLEDHEQVHSLPHYTGVPNSLYEEEQ
jgi:divalent metal cation (Fe/Co/Zn/Cd) transporter